MCLRLITRASHSGSRLNSNITGFAGSGQATVALFGCFSQENEPPNCSTSATRKSVWNAHEQIVGRLVSACDDDVAKKSFWYMAQALIIPPALSVAVLTDILNHRRFLGLADSQYQQNLVV